MPLSSKKRTHIVVIYIMKKIAYSFVLWFAACAFGFVQPMQAQLYKNPSYTAEERAADLLKRMTLEEKIA